LHGCFIGASNDDETKTEDSATLVSQKWNITVQFIPKESYSCAVSYYLAIVN
jgi:hypothetical protein